MIFWRRSEASGDRRSLASLAGDLLDPLFLRLRTSRVQQLCRQVTQRVGGLAQAEERFGTGWQMTRGRRLREISACVLALRELRTRVEHSKRDYQELEEQFEQTKGPEERAFLLRRFVEQHVESDRKLAIDPAAIRHGFDLVTLREQLDLGWRLDDIDQEIYLAVVGGAIADEVVWAFSEAADVDPVAHLQGFFATNEGTLCLERYAAPELNWRLQVVSLGAMGHIAGAMPREWWSMLYPQAVFTLLFKRAYADDAPVWVQIAALRALHACDEDRWLATCADRLAEGSLRQDDDLFVRHAIVRDLGTAERIEEAVDILAGSLLPGDISDYVRVGAMASLAAMPLAFSRVHLQRGLGLFADQQGDSCHQVRTAAVLGMVGRIGKADGNERTLLANLLRQVLGNEKHEVPLRALLEALPAALPYDEAVGQAERLPGQVPLYCEPFLRAIDSLICDTTISLPLRRIAQETRDEILTRSLAGFSPEVDDLRRRLGRIGEGGFLRWRLPGKRGTVVDDHRIGRLLVHASREGFGLYWRRRGRHLLIQKGDRFVSRFWRLWYEFWHPGPDKRQGFFHIVGRSFAGVDRAHPLLLGEESPTKVPGEPLFRDAEGQWRRYLPLVDDFISLLGLAGRPGRREVRLHAAQGVTVLKRPVRMRDRWRARRKLLQDYAGLAKLRNMTLDELEKGTDRHPFIAAMRELGFVIEFHPAGWLDRHRHWHPLVDPTLQIYFGMPVITLPTEARQVAPELGSVGVTVLHQGSFADTDFDDDTASVQDRPTEVITRVQVAGDGGELFEELPADAGAGIDPRISAEVAAAAAAVASGSDRLSRERTEALARAAEQRLRDAEDEQLADAARSSTADSQLIESVAKASLRRRRRTERYTKLDKDQAEAETGDLDRYEHGDTELLPVVDPSRVEQERRRLVEEREERETEPHHRSVTQQLRHQAAQSHEGDDDDDDGLSPSSVRRPAIRGAAIEPKGEVQPGEGPDEPATDVEERD